MKPMFSDSPGAWTRTPRGAVSQADYANPFDIGANMKPMKRSTLQALGIVTVVGLILAVVAVVLILGGVRL